eukprot:13346117-Alexandrium_andersonii.AAC.1
MPGLLTAPGTDWACGHCEDLVRRGRDASRQCGQERPGAPVREPGPGRWRCPRCKTRNNGTANYCRCG